MLTRITKAVLSGKNTFVVVVVAVTSAVAAIPSWAATQTVELNLNLAKAKSGNAAAAFWLSQYYKESGREDKYRLWLNMALDRGYPGAMVEIGYSKPYLSYSAFRCNSLQVDIVTTCEGIDATERRPSCYLQHIAITTDQKQYKDAFLINRDFRTDATIATAASCIKGNGKSYLTVNSGNFGSGRTCSDCERKDYFSGEGDYLGSDNSDKGKEIFIGFKEIDLQISEEVNRLTPADGVSQSFTINIYPTVTEVRHGNVR